MRRLLIPAAIFAMALPALAGRNHYGNHGLSVTIDDDGDVTDCSQLRVTYDDRVVPVISEDVAVGSLRSLKVRSDRNGGIRVTGGGSAFSVKVCKASVLGDARDVRVRLDGNEVSAERGEDNNSIVYFLVQAPRSASLELSANNGPIGIDSFDGTMTARAQNGPISLKDSSGTLDISTVNGPIAFAGNSGIVKLHATNGPISVKLAGSSWTTGTLDAVTQNGPLTLKLPRGYRSGVVVESDGNGPIACRAEACRDVRRFNDYGDDERPRRIELGSGAKAITLSTNNGPVAIKED